MRTNTRQPGKRRWRRGTAGAFRSEALVEEAAAPACVLDSQGRVIVANRALEVLLGVGVSGGVAGPHPAGTGLPARRGAGPCGRAAGAGRGAGPLPGRGPLGADPLPRAGLGQLGPVAGPRPPGPARAGHRHGPRPDRDEALRPPRPLLRVLVQADRRRRLQPPGADRRGPDHLPLHPLRHGPGVAAGRRRPGLQPRPGSAAATASRSCTRPAKRSPTSPARACPAWPGPGASRCCWRTSATWDVSTGPSPPSGPASGRPWPPPRSGSSR